MVADHGFMDFCMFLYLSALCTILYVLYSVGFLSKVDVKVKKSPFKQIDVVYKFVSSGIPECRRLLAEVQTLAPYLDTFIIEQKVPYEHSTCGHGHAVGAIVRSNEEVIDADSCLKLLVKGYSLASFPAVDNVVMATFPYVNQLSIITSIPRVYPLLRSYIEKGKLCAHPLIQVFTREEILFLAPLSRQGSFYVREAISRYNGSYGTDSNEEDKDSSCSSKKSNSMAPPVFEEKKPSLQMKILNKFCKCDVFNRSQSCEYCKRAL